MRKGTPSSRDNKEKVVFRDKGRIGRLKDMMYSRSTQPLERPRRELHARPPAVDDDWHFDDDAPEAHRASRRSSYSFASVLLIGSALFFAVAMSVAIWFVATGSNTVSARNIDIEIIGPRTIEGGDVLALQVAVTNRNDAPLELADLVVTYPPGTRMPANLQESMETQRLPLGTIAPGETRTGTVRAVLFGRDGQRATVTVALEYRIRGSSALFSAEARHALLVSSGTMSIAIDADAEAVAGQDTTLAVTVTSHAKTDVRDVVLVADMPFGFRIQKTDPPAARDGWWELGTLGPGESITVTMLGTIEGQSGDERTWRFVAGVRDPVRTGTLSATLAEVTHRIRLARPFVAMALEFDGKTAREYVARTGKTIPVTLKWRNNLGTTLSDVVIAATVGGSGFDPFGMTTDRGFFRSIDNIVLWDKTTTRGELATVTAGEEGALTLRMTPKSADALADVRDPTITFELHAAAQRLSESGVPETIQTAVKEEIKLATDVTFSGRGLYFENPLGSVGPLPPKIEHETTYGILWEVSNTTNMVRDAKVVATLPPYVRWLNVVSPSVERVTYNKDDGTVTWHVDKLYPGTGVGERPPRRVIFGIGLVPSTSQLGQEPPLVRDQTFTGVDNFIFTDARPDDARIELPATDITTKLTEADFGDTYGRVIR